MASSSSSSSFQDDHVDGHDKRDPAPATATAESHNIYIQVEGLDPSWVSKFSERGSNSIVPRKLRVSSADISCSIHRVPPKLRRLNEDAYSPESISIGPLHYDKREGPLKAMEEHKRRYLDNILSRTGEGTLERCLVAVKALEETARKCYSEVTVELDSFSFVEMLILDGCFIIEFFRKENSDYETDHDCDPIFQLEWLHNAIMADLLVLENQIPFVILQCLFDLIYPRNDVSSPSSSFVEWVLRGYGQSKWNEVGDKIKKFNIQIQHLLHLFHTGDVVCIEDKSSGSWKLTDLIPTASRLREGGIEFRKRDGVTSELEIKFHKGVIQIPQVPIWGMTNIILLNCIAFEHCYKHCKHYYTAYAYFMDCLINTDKDIEVLCQNGIIMNRLGSDEELSAFFNNMGRELLAPKDFYLGGVCEQIHEYHSRPWPKLRAALVRDYFKNPWAIISFFAALLLLLLTIIQAFFSSFPKFAYGN